MDPKVNDETSLGINLKWLVQIIVVAALAVWGYFGLTSEISQLQIDVMRMKDAVEMNSEFRVKWPLGQLGALPDDAEQNMRLRFIEKDIQVISSKAAGNKCPVCWKIRQNACERAGHCHLV